MPDNKDFERSLERAIDPHVAKLTPRKTEESIEALIARIRATCKTLNDLCDEVDRSIAESEKHARAAADNLMDLIKRVK